MSFREAVDGLYLCTTCNIVSRERSQECIHHHVIRQREYSPAVSSSGNTAALEYRVRQYAAVGRAMHEAPIEKKPEGSVQAPVGVQAATRRRLLLSCFDIVVRDPELRAMLREILAHRERVLAESDKRAISRAVIDGSTVVAIFYHVGLFKLLVAVASFVDRVWGRRA